jgi:hypothetical protein
MVHLQIFLRFKELNSLSFFCQKFTLIPYFSILSVVESVWPEFLTWLRQSTTTYLKNRQQH